MRHLDMTFNELRMLATFNGEFWHVFLNDSVTGTHATVRWDDEDLWSFVTLMLGSEQLEQRPRLCVSLVTRVDALFKELPLALRQF
jgi:hypothetical protein